MKHLYIENRVHRVHLSRENRQTEVLQTSEILTTANEITNMAAQNIPLQGEQSPAAELLYYQAKELYDLHSKGMITAEVGKERKQQIISSYISNINIEKRYIEQNFQMAAFWKTIEAAGRNYAKDRTIENADAFFKAVYGLLPKGV